MTERPILMSGPMVRAILDGRKTQTRRVVKPQPSHFTPSPNVHHPRHPAAYFDAYCNAPKTGANPRGMSDRWCWWTPDNRQGPDWIRCPYGAPGDRLWVRETWGTGGYFPWPYGYRADGKEYPGECWRPSIHMPRRASRLTLEVTVVRVERLQAITQADARAEGVVDTSGAWDHVPGGLLDTSRAGPRGAFEALWNSINGADSWDANPWVWVVEFRRVEGGTP